MVNKKTNERIKRYEEIFKQVNSRDKGIFATSETIQSNHALTLQLLKMEREDEMLDELSTWSWT